MTCVVLGDIFSVTLQLSSHRTVKQILIGYSTKIVGQTMVPVKITCCAGTVYNEFTTLVIIIVLKLQCNNKFMWCFDKAKQVYLCRVYKKR